jgi:WD40 repeat protein
MRSSRASLLLALATAASTGCARFGFEQLPVGDAPNQVDLHASDTGVTPEPSPDASASPAAPEDAGQTPSGSGGTGDSSAGGTGNAGSGGSAGDTGGGGTGSVAARCIAFGAFDPPVLVAGLNESSSIGPALSDDALTLLYATLNPSDIFITTRPDRDSPFGPGTLLGNVNQSGTDVTPFLADGGLTLLLASDRFTAQGYNDLMVATRATLSDPFSTPTTIANVNSPGIELAPQLSTDGLRLYFSSDSSNQGGADRDIWLATRATRSASFSAPSRVPGLNSQSAEFGPSLNEDELEVFIASDRPGGEGSMDLWRATRATRGDAFGSPQNVSELNGGGYETDPRLSADGSELFFSSSRSGAQVLWSARRTCVTFAP